MQLDKNNTVEFEVIQESTPDTKPTESDLEGLNFNQKEIESAKKFKLIAENGDKNESKNEGGKNEDGKQDSTESGESKQNEKDAQKTEEVEQEVVSKDKIDEYEEMFDNPEIEKQNISKYSKHEQGTYFRMKKEVKRRKAALIDKEHAEIRLKAEIEKNKNLMKQIEDFNSKNKEKADLLGTEEEGIKIENPDPKDVEKTEQEDKLNRARIIDQHLQSFESDASAKYDDFQESVKLADDIYKNIDTVFKDNPRLKSKAIHRIQELQFAIANADQYVDSNYTPADMAYEIGQLHPNYKAANPGADKPSKETQGNLDPEQLKKMAENARRKSSASVSGGSSKRVVSYEDLTAQDLASMNTAQFMKIPREVRDRVLRS